MPRLSSLAATAVLAAALPAQFVLTAPDAYYATREGNSNFVLPWNVGASGGRVQFVHDSTVFTGQGVTTPIRITGLAYRIDAIANTWSGGTYPNVVVAMSTCPVDHLAVVNTFASNHGPDLATVYSGAVAIVGGAGGNAPSLQYATITLASPFVYDPTTGADLVVDFTVNTGWVGNGGVATGAVDHVGPGAPVPALASRVWVSGTPGASTGNASFSPTFGYSPVCDFTYEPAVGLWANFSAAPPTGSSPLNVQFTDRSVTDAPNGVLAWQWDLNGDSVVDSTAQNPTFTYASCGSYTVSLTVNDGVHPPSTRTVAAFVVTDTVTASFTATVLPGNLVQLTDTSTPTPTSWAWDFDNDGLVDSTQQNPVFAAPSGNAAYQVSLTASRLCGPASVARQGVAVTPNALTTNLLTNQGFFGTIGGNLFDLTVLNPTGISIGAITTCPYTDGTLAVGAPLQCELYVTDAAGGYAANHATPAAWRRVATGSGYFLGGNAGSPRPITLTLNRPVYLPAGTYGFAVYMIGSGMAFRSGTVTLGNADLSITAGSAKTGLFNAAQTAQRPWCGTLHYDTAGTGGSAGYGFFGSGCPTSLGGVSGQTLVSRPVLGGTLTANVTGLPVDVGVLLVGLSNTVSAFGPLPLDVAPLGIPGCFARVSLDGTAVVLGAGGVGSWSLPIPAQPSLAAFQLYTQCLVFDAPANAFGAVLGDAWAGILGN
jgi:PKD repeat protein